jgi:hypothetical protein
MSMAPIVQSHYPVYLIFQTVYMIAVLQDVPANQMGIFRKLQTPWIQKTSLFAEDHVPSQSCEPRRPAHRAHYTNHHRSLAIATYLL